MARLLLIVGTGGLARETGQLARRIDPDSERWEKISYVASSSAEKATVLPFGRVDFSDEDLENSPIPADAAIAVADPLLRRKIASRLAGLGNIAFPNLIHPAVHLDQDLNRFGKGNLVAQGVIVTCGVVAGDFNILNKGCMVGHDVELGSFDTINPFASVSGNAHIGDCCLIGIGARVLEKLQIAERTTIGAGSVVLADIVEPGLTFVGMPAKKLR